MNVFNEYIENPNLIPKRKYNNKTKVKSITILTKDMTRFEFDRLEKDILNTKARIIGFNKV